MIDPEVVPVPGVGRRAVWRDLPVLIIIIAGLFHFGRGAEVDGLVFVTVGVALLVAEVRGRGVPVPARAVRPLRARWILFGAVLCLGYGVLVGRWELASPGVVVAIAVPGLLILPLAWRVRPRPSGRPGAGKWVWAGVMVLVCLWELVSFLSQPDPQTDSYDHPTLSAIFNPMFRSPAVRVVALVVWLAVGLWLARRLATEPAGEGER